MIKLSQKMIFKNYIFDVFLMLNLQMMFTKMSFEFVKADIIHCINEFFLKIFREKNDENTHREQ